MAIFHRNISNVDGDVIYYRSLNSIDRS